MVGSIPPPLAAPSRRAVTAVAVRRGPGARRRRAGRARARASSAARRCSRSRRRDWRRRRPAPRGAPAPARGSRRPACARRRGRTARRRWSCRGGRLCRPSCPGRRTRPRRRGCRRRSGTAGRSRGRTRGRSRAPPPETPHSRAAPATAASIRRPVLRACSWRSSSSRVAVAATSMYCPPTMPCTPVAQATSDSAATHARGLALLAVGDQPEGFGEQAVAGEDGDVFAELT